jgi:hypothetical protein
MKNEDLIRETLRAIDEYAFLSKESIKDIKRVEHICTVHPKLLAEAYPNERNCGSESFSSYANRMKYCFFGNDFGQLYAGFWFSATAEGMFARWHQCPRV